MDKRIILVVIIGVPIALLALPAVRAVVALVSRPAAPGLVDGKLAPLKPTPNNVASYAAAAYPQMEPLRYEGSQADALQRLLAIIADMPRTRVEKIDGNYVHVTFRTPMMHFIDDVEFLFDDAAGRIDFRSASRLGQGDAGVNQRRMQEVQARFAAAGN